MAVTQWRDYRIQGFNSIRLHHEFVEARGLMVFIKSDISFARIDLSSFDDPSIKIIIFRVAQASKNLVVAGVYRHPNMVTPANTYDKIFAILCKFDQHILVGDFNTHHSV